PRRMISRALIAGVLVFAAALAVAATPALAAPFIVIESPASGTVTNQTRPVVSGVSSDTTAADAVTVTISSEGSVVETAEAEPDSSGEWSVQVGKLADGEYT